MRVPRREKQERERAQRGRDRHRVRSVVMHVAFLYSEFWLDDTDRVIEIKNLAHTNQKISEF